VPSQGAAFLRTHAESTLRAERVAGDPAPS
jgi:hypothetical protein